MRHKGNIVLKLTEKQIAYLLNNSDIELEEKIINLNDEYVTTNIFIYVDKDKNNGK